MFNNSTNPRFSTKFPPFAFFFSIELFQSCVELGFSFHFVKNKKLILSQWLPNDIASKLPLGPTHQVGVGTVVFHPKDPSLMLVVQEKTGPGKYAVN